MCYFLAIKTLLKQCPPCPAAPALAHIHQYLMFKQTIIKTYVQSNFGTNRTGVGKTAHNFSGCLVLCQKLGMRAVYSVRVQWVGLSIALNMLEEPQQICLISYHQQHWKYQEQQRKQPQNTLVLNSCSGLKVKLINFI